MTSETPREWELRRTLRHDELTAVRQPWAEAIEGGLGPIDGIVAIKREARRRPGCRVSAVFQR